MNKFDLKKYISNNPLLKERFGDDDDPRYSEKRFTPNPDDITMMSDEDEDYAKTEYTEDEVKYSLGVDDGYEGWVDLAFSKGFTYDEDSDIWRGPEINENIGMEDGEEKITYYAKELVGMVSPGDDEGVQGLLNYLLDNIDEMPEDWDGDFIDEYYDDILDQANALDMDQVFKKVDYNLGLGPERHGVDETKTTVSELKTRIKEIIKSTLNEDRGSEIKNETLKALENWYDTKKPSPSLFDLQKISHIKMDRVQSAIKNNKTAKDAMKAIFKGIDLNEVKTDEYGNHLEPQFQKGDKITYLSHPGVITGVNKTPDGKYTYNVSYDKGEGKTKVPFIFNKGGEIKKA